MLFYIFYNISCKAAHKGNKQLRQSERVHTGLGDDGKQSKPSLRQRMPVISPNR